MTTTNVYQGLASDKSTSRILQAPGGGSSNIFGHYQENSNQEQEQRRQRETEAVVQSVNRGGAGGDVHDDYQDNKDSFAANRQRNQGAGAPFAVSDNQVSTGQPQRPTAYHHQPTGGDNRTAQQMQAANRTRNQGSGAPFATGDNQQVAMQSDRPAHHQQVIGDDYQTPQQRQANKDDCEESSEEEEEAKKVHNPAKNPNKAGNSFSNLFGDSDHGVANGGKARGQVSKFNPITWSSKQRSQLRSSEDEFSSVTGANGVRPAGYRRADDDNEAPHLRLAGAMTVSQFNPVTWSAKAGARSPPGVMSPNTESPSTPPAGMVRKSVLADEHIKPLNPYTKAILSSCSSSISPNHHFAIRVSPITGYSPYLPSDPCVEPKILKNYQPIAGILPSLSEPLVPAGPKPYYPLESIIPMSPRPVRSPSGVNAVESHAYQPNHESIIPMSPLSLPVHGDSEEELTDDNFVDQTGCGSGRQSERNPVTGEGLPPISSPTIKCFSNPGVNHHDPLHWTRSENQLAALTLNDVDIPMKSKGHGVLSQQQVSTHNPVTWQAYSNFDADQDHPQHRSRFENFATTKAGTFNPITGQDHVDVPSTRVKAPPGGQSSIQF